MAKKVLESPRDVKKTKAADPAKDYGDVLTKKNKIIITIGIVVIILGFFALAQPPVNGFLTMTVAPVLLVVGLVVIIPIGIMIRDKKTEQGD